MFAFCQDEVAKTDQRVAPEYVDPRDPQALLEKLDHRDVPVPAQLGLLGLLDHPDLLARADPPGGEDQMGSPGPEE
jgi:hypothetical protein